MSPIAPATASETQQLALHLQSITKEFPGVRALDNVNLEVAAGEIHGIVGENGAGKSTLMAITSGALKADAGSVEIRGKELREADPETARELGIAIVRQEPALMPDLTVAENLYLAASESNRVSLKSLNDWAQNALSVWGNTSIDPRSRIEELGPQQRFIVEICRALAQKPKVLILDEPTEHLVAEEVEVLFGHVRSLVQQGTAVVYISHRIHEVKVISDRITVLRNGKTTGTFDAEDLTEDQIVQLIIGRELDVFFPEKVVNQALDKEPYLTVTSLSNSNLSKISLQIRRGEVLGLAGIEDNGQKNLLRALAGLESASGTVSVGGKNLRLGDPRISASRGITYLTGDRHNEGVLSGLTVNENIVFRSLRRLSKAGWLSNKKIRDFSLGIVRSFNVKTPNLDTPIDSLSGGNQQKALLGGALATDPSIFLVEEPTQGVDVGAKSEIYQLLRDAAQQGAIVIVHSSSAFELAGIADRVLVLSRGQVIRELQGDEITEEAITGSALKSDTERIRVSKSDQKRSNWWSGDSAPVVLVSALVVLLAAIGTIVNVRFMSPTNLNGILMLTVPLALIAIGQLFVVMTSGIDMSTGPLMGLVPVIASFYFVDGISGLFQGLGWLYILLAVLAVGVVNWALIDLVRLSPIIATLITYIAIQAFSYTLRPTRGGTISYAVMDPIKSVLGFVPVAFILVLVLALILGYALKKSRPGVAIRAVGSDDESARVNGLSPRLVRFGAYVLSALFSGLAGVVLISINGTGDPAAGVSYTLLGITAAVLGGASLFGGRGSFLGVLMGALLINVVNSMTVFLRLTPDWQYYLIGAMTIGAVAFYSTARKKAVASN